MQMGDLLRLVRMDACASCTRGYHATSATTAWSERPRTPTYVGCETRGEDQRALRSREFAHRLSRTTASGCHARPPASDANCAVRITREPSPSFIASDARPVTCRMLAPRCSDRRSRSAHASHVLMRSLLPALRSVFSVGFVNPVQCFYCLAFRPIVTTTDYNDTLDCIV